jgi:hypothetical protein
VDAGWETRGAEDRQAQRLSLGAGRKGAVFMFSVSFRLFSRPSSILPSMTVCSDRPPAVFLSSKTYVLRSALDPVLIPFDARR